MRSIGEGDTVPDPHRAQAWHRLGIARLQAGKLAEARRALERAITLDPSSSELCNNFAILLQKLGRPDLASDQYEAALAHDPDNADIHSNLAAALALIGRYDEALAHVRRALGLRPGLASAYVHAAVTELECGRYKTALQWIEAILPAAPDNVEILLLYAEILRRLDRSDEGLASCQRAIALAPSCDRAHNILGLLLKAQARDAEALAAFATAASLTPTPSLSLANHGMLLLELGRQQEAIDLLDGALALHPDAVELCYARVQARRFAVPESDIHRMEAMLGDERAVAYNDRLQLHYALGGAYLRSGDAERAFAHLAAGAGLKRATIRYDAAATERRIAGIEAAFPREIFRRSPDGFIASELPIFVIGMPRSGTTLVEQILASHPQIHGAGEPRYLEQAICRSVVASDAPSFPDFVGRYDRTQLDGIALDYLARLAAGAPAAERIVDKMMHNTLYAGLIHLMLPRARIIHCRRDPIDTCLSCYATLFTDGQEFSYDLAELGRHYRASDRLIAHWRAVLPPDIFLEIDYESVVENLEAEARRLVEFCGLPWSSSCLRFHETQRPVRTASMAQVRQPLYRTSVGRGRRFEPYLGPLLKALSQPSPETLSSSGRRIAR